MKSFSKAVFVSVLLGLFSFCLPAICSAQLATKIHINQNTDTILIQAQITGLPVEITSLNLSKQAEIIDVSGLEITPNGDAGYLLKTTGGNSAQIKYALKIDQSQIQYLTEDQNWYPRSKPDVMQTFSVDAEMQKGIQVVHSATGQNQSGVSVVIGKFVKYLSPSQKIAIYLKNEDQDLANTLIENLDSYLLDDEKNFGAYPYDQFSVVESSDEIGYAFPRMTWIGSQLLRFPFILKTSLPHELLHSWWGNSVFVDYKTGNWCEGLTVFGADYALLTESEKVTYRRKALIEYMDYVKTANEISLSEFISRGEDKSLQAIGYNKSLMMFVMLEQLVGADVMKQGLSSFSQQYKYKQASYADLFQILGKLSFQKEDALHNFFKTWILEKGAITFDSLKASVMVSAAPQPATFELNFAISQNELDKIQSVPVEFLIYFEDGTRQTVSTTLAIETKLKFVKRPVHFVVDPAFKIFRKLSDQERPVTFSKFFASTQASIQSSDEVLKTVQTVFPNINFQSVKKVPQPAAPQPAAPTDFNTPGILLIESYGGGIDEIDQVLIKRSVQLKKDSVQIDGQNISLAENGYFISIKIKAKMVILFQTNVSLPVNRWFERWSHYGAQGFVILSPKAAIKQGVWDEAFIQDL